MRHADCMINSSVRAHVARTSRPFTISQHPLRCGVQTRAQHRWGAGPSIGGAQFRKFCWRQAEHGLQRASYMGIRAVQITVWTLMDSLQWLERRLTLRYRAAQLYDAACYQARQINMQWGLQQRLHDIRQDFIRHWPARKDRLRSFMATPLGKVSAVMFLFVAARTGILSFLFMLILAQSWLAPLLLLAWARRNGAWPPGGQQSSDPPFSSPFGHFFRGQSPGEQRRQASHPADDVIDVDWNVVT